MTPYFAAVVLAESLLDRIRSPATTAAEIDNIERECTRLWGDGRIDDDQYQGLREAAHARKRRQQAAAGRRGQIGAALTGLPTATTRIVASTGAERTVKIRIMSAEERAVRSERLRERRRIARLAGWEATYAAMFTQGEQTALSSSFSESARPDSATSP